MKYFVSNQPEKPLFLIYRSERDKERPKGSEKEIEILGLVKSPPGTISCYIKK